MDKRQVDILIVGGGLIGACLMRALQGSGYSCLLVERHPLDNRVEEDFDARSLALSPASIRILNGLGIWQSIEPYATRIHHIQVSEQGGLGHTILKDKKDTPLGHVVEMQTMSRCLYESLASENIMTGAKLLTFDKQTQLASIEINGVKQQWHTKLLVAADGLHSTVRDLLQLAIDVKEYAQLALATNIGLARPHQHQAFERFTRFGPLAMLPMQNQRAALIWTLPVEQANYLRDCDESEFLKTLKLAFGYRMGRLLKVGKRQTFPLCQAIMPKQIDGSVVFIGNAAHTLHPVAGQGFNLGLRDVATLAQCIHQKGITPAMLEAYERMRQYDHHATRFLTDGLINTFTSTLPGIKSLRNVGLLAMDNSVFLQNLLKRHARGFAGIVPDLVCNIPLVTKHHLQ